MSAWAYSLMGKQSVDWAGGIPASLPDKELQPCPTSWMQHDFVAAENYRATKHMEYTMSLVHSKGCLVSRAGLPGPCKCIRSRSVYSWSRLTSDKVRLRYFAELITDMVKKMLMTTGILYRNHISHPLAQINCVVAIQESQVLH